MSTLSPVPSPNTSTAFLPPPSATSLLFPSGPSSCSSKPRIPIPNGLRKGQLVHSDDDCLVFREEERSLASGGHLTFLVAPALSSIYEFSPASVPLLSRLHMLAQALLVDQFTSASSFNQNNPSSSSSSSSTTFPPSSPLPGRSQLQERIGFVTSPFKDPLNPGHPNLTLHAILGPLDKASYYTRGFPFGPLGFYSLEDLIAEIRESSSNNRIKSGYSNSSSSSSRRPRPLESVLDAGSRAGLSNGVEITPSGDLISPPQDAYDNPPPPSAQTHSHARLDPASSSPSLEAPGSPYLDAGSKGTTSQQTLLGARERMLVGEVPEGSKKGKAKVAREDEGEEVGEEVDLGVAASPAGAVGLEEAPVLGAVVVSEELR
ncbi:hypothetical protein BDY24DRAFT_444338 [Mrakia frigida]|uniref:uncharacterized protein n=1 Tax=Mrakia frigida TaxID=29902 RepID=UPI003FCC1810